MSMLLFLLACNSTSEEGAAPVVVAAPGPAPAAIVAPANASEPAAVAAYWEGGSLSYGEVTTPIQSQLDQMLSEYLMSRYDAEYQATEQKMDEAILNAEAKKRGLAALEDLLKLEVSDKVAAPTEAEITDAYAALQRKLRGQSKEEARSVLVSAVTQKKQGERYAQYIEELRGKYGATVQLTFPDVPRIPVSADDDPFIGPADAPITIVQFAEFQCPYCGKARESIDRVLANYDGKVKFVFRDFPLGFHDKAIPAAIAANCAEKQGKYWEVHDAFMKDQTALAEADLQRVAKAAKLDLGAWEECRKDPAMEAEIKKDEADGQAVGVTGTPAFFINGVFINGAQPYPKFKAIIDAELKRG
jgi:protein-disulfide isomerase